ncbi:hypothetical protein [Staphylococcus argenteus]|uniref:hypothetical protein n=1 Tax=Staphylococcus argenteus TaxID=985002 RepID=UPI000AABC496|nr:hypothetical protein [Staphylococcus argenteus]MCG9812339.1 hypothetical protein [Staphylococcus argenteus]MCG9825308.1 hypothetical protein [Staphylococcus argenteus]
MATVILDHLSIGIMYIIYIQTQNLVSFSDYLIGILIIVVWYIIGIRIIVNKSFEDMNSPVFICI